MKFQVLNLIPSFVLLCEFFQIDFFKDKPLTAMVTKGQKVNVSARSICTAKGKDMSPIALELQAIAVSLDPNIVPTTAPSPTR